MPTLQSAVAPQQPASSASSRPTIQSHIRVNTAHYPHADDPYPYTSELDSWLSAPRFAPPAAAARGGGGPQQNHHHHQQEQQQQAFAAHERQALEASQVWSKPPTHPDLALFESYASLGKPAGSLQGAAGGGGAPSRFRVLCLPSEVALFQASVLGTTCSLDDLGACASWQAAWGLTASLTSGLGGASGGPSSSQASAPPAAGLSKATLASNLLGPLCRTALPSAGIAGAPHAIPDDPMLVQYVDADTFRAPVEPVVSLLTGPRRLTKAVHREAVATAFANSSSA